MTNSINKGRRGERELAHEINKFGYDCRRTAQYNGKELDSKADVVGLRGIHIECKRVEKLNIDNAIEQAVRDAKDEMPAVFHRKNGKKWLVTVRLEDFMRLYKADEKLKQMAKLP